MKGNLQKTGTLVIITPMSRLTRFQHILDGIVLCLLLCILLVGDAQPVTQDIVEQIRLYTRQVEFDYVNWTLNALGSKLAQASIGTPFYFDSSERRLIVRSYLKVTERILQDEYSLSLVFSDPSVPDPETASTVLRKELESQYTRQKSLAPFAEAILQEQISTILAELDLTTGGQPIPPVLFHISPLPFHLVVSPRDHIEQLAAISLLPDLSVDRQVALESQVDQGMGVSSLVVPVGGIGSYPTMVMRTTAFTWLEDTIAHEWIHNWLTLRPLGMNYDTTPELRTMNETTASIAGGEISRLVLERFYPDLLAGVTVSPVNSKQVHKLAARTDFDFNKEMHVTRVHVDELLAQGKIKEAESYMEQRRQFFWDNGYPIRKLNQAYFAFYGAYADIPGGAAGEDPVGPAVRALRQRSHSLTEFLKTMAKLSSFQELLDLLAQ